MNAIISKELLGEVLGESIKSFQLDIGKYIAYQTNDVGGYNDTINIYELAHKCKEWAYDNGWYIQERKCVSGIYEYMAQSKGLVVTPSFYDVFDLCQHILDNKATK